MAHQAPNIQLCASGSGGGEVKELELFGNQHRRGWTHRQRESSWN